GSQSGVFRQKVDDLWYAFTDFEPTDARMAVPSFDDPRFKIPWKLTLRVPPGMRAFANAPEVRSSPIESGWRRVEFAATRPLPSYLVAFAVGPFDVLDGASSPVPIRVIATRGRAALGAQALAVVPPMLVELERYLGSKTPFPKLDFLAVPQFNGAMENPGLITFAAPILLVGPTGEARTSSWRERHRLMAGIMAHELAHLWFGDLVTMRWWDELWLNEGLATWLSDRLMAVTSPNDAGLVLDVADKRQGLEIDRRGRPIPVRYTPARAPDVGDLFSPLTYRKGGAIVTMFEAFMGEEPMRAGLRRYLADNAGGSVTTAELAAALSAAAGRDLAPALSSFLDQPGVPVVDAALTCARGKPTVSLRQSGYALLGSDAVAARATQRWQIPVCVAWEGGAAPVCTLLAEERATLELPAARCPAWIHPNPGERGYYVYSLPPDQLRALAAAPHLTAREQAGLVDDVEALLAAGRAPLDAALDATWSLARRRDRLTALRASDMLDLIGRALVGSGQRRAFAARLRAAYGPLAVQLGLQPRDGESSLDVQLRQSLVPLIARQGDDRALQREALRRFSAWLDQPRRTEPGFVELGMLYQIAPLAGGAALFDRIVAAGRGRPSRGLPALGGFREPALVQRALALAAHGRMEPLQALTVLAALLHDSGSHDVALPVALAEYPALAARLSDEQRPRAPGAFGSACRSSARPQVEEALRRSLARDATLPRAAVAVLDAVSACAAFRARYLSEAAAYFR
ncbi:MAG TPA: M1 family metallopeptidase, partial [Kofleriaceae bacterium]|nr:M1 family metallopeptidase [Kofleriaceae bacterium]